MENNIVKFYKKDAAENPDAVLEQAIGVYESLVIIGWDKDNKMDVRSTLNLTQGEIHYLLSIFQHKLLNGDYDI